MIGDIRVEYCPICESETDHLQGCFKCREINGELFLHDVSFSDSLKIFSNGFKEFVFSEREGFIDSAAPGDFVQTRQGGMDFEELFSPQIRSLKCTQCQHLIKLSRFP